MEAEGDGTSAGWWGAVRPMMCIVQVAAAGFWIYSAVRWVGRGEAIYAIPSVLLVVASLIWIAKLGRRRPLLPSSWDPEHTVVRVSARQEARTAIYAGVFPVLFALNALGASRGDPTPAGLVLSSIFVLVILLAIVSLSSARTSELCLTADELLLTVPRGAFGVVERRRARDKVTGYRRRFGSIELLPWPLPVGTRGRIAQEQRLVVPSQVLARADVERALRLHRIPVT
jgi:hypothetical protein